MALAGRSALVAHSVKANSNLAILDVVARTADRCFMPVTVGGGVRAPEDIRRLLLAGADKVSINTAAVQDNIRDAIGMVGQRLEANVHIVTASGTATQNIVTAVNRAGVRVDLLPTPPMATVFLGRMLRVGGMGEMAGRVKPIAVTALFSALWVTVLSL